MPEDLHCPHCGAPLDYSGAGATIRCPYCKTSVVVPPELRAAPATRGPRLRITAPMIALAGVLLLAFVVVQIFQGVFNSASQAISVTPVSLPLATATFAPRPSEMPSATPTPGYARVGIQFGGEGTGQGKLADARSLALDGSGNVYVAEYTGGRIQAFDASGRYAHEWFAGQSKSHIYAMTADRKGTVYAVVDGRIERYEGSSGKPLGAIAYSNGDLFGAVALAQDGGLLAMWYEARWGVITSLEGHREDLVRFGADGNVLNVWPSIISNETGDAELDTSLAFDAKGNILALGGTFEHTLFQYTREGKLITRLVQPDKAKRILEGPRGLAVDQQGRIFIGDYSGVEVFDAGGHLLGVLGDSRSPYDLKSGPDGNLWVLNNHQVTQFIVNPQ